MRGSRWRGDGATACHRQRAGQAWTMAAEGGQAGSGDGGMGQRERGQLWGRDVTCLSYFGDDSAAAAAYKQREVEAGLKSVASGSSRATRLLPCGEASALQRGSLRSVLTLRRSCCPYLALWPCLSCPLAWPPWHRAGQRQGSLWGLLGWGPSLTGKGDQQIRERSPERSPPWPRLSSSSKAGREPLCPQGLHLCMGHSRCPGPAAFTSDEGQVGEQLQLPADVQLEVAEGGRGCRTEALQ